MNLYLAIIATLLVITQIIRVLQNFANLYHQYKVANKQLDSVEEMTKEDIEQQRRVCKLAEQYFAEKHGMIL